MWIIGIDGGGTKCKAGLFDSKGVLLTHSLSGPANLFTDFNAGIQQIEKACDLLITQMFNEHNISISKTQCHLVAGCAGGEVKSTKESFLNWQHAYASASLTTDLHVAGLAAKKGEDCFLAIIGTGSSFAKLHQHKISQFGGYGLLLGDIASGAWLGKQAVSWFLQALENSTTGDPLYASMCNHLGTNVQNIVEQFGHAKSSQFGELAPHILKRKGLSPMVDEWLEEGAQYLSSMLRTHNQQNLPVFLIGGLSEYYLLRLVSLGFKNVVKSSADPIYGAYIYQQLRLR